MVDSIPGVRNRIFLFYAHKNKQKMKKLLLLAFAASVLAACSDDEYNYFELPASYTVAFEEARLGEDGYIWGKSQAVTLGEDDKEAAFFGVGSKYFFAPIYTEGDVPIAVYRLSRPLRDGLRFVERLRDFEPYGYEYGRFCQ